ncbi:sulfotransferase [Aliiruegeria lutimaris]|uniref:Sulfotransferase family protein n=1 Tax=Aliiruegeria lutimaris TaxID=571298 RepID=A0A1G8T008_9RHOB|nr:sulfotransferase [Aliiruegeria lutimaris]SDJ34882.1 Sulfotransferase family protein [Aliiruegeria lutimaris]
MKHIFIVTFGRTGSTALLKTLNAIEGACIRGQNGALLCSLAEAAEALADRHRERSGNRARFTGNPWYGINEANPEAFAHSLARSFVRDVLNPPEGTRITGFKEINYTDETLTDRNFDAVLGFMLRYFEDPHIIFLTRDPAEASHSGWWQDRDQDVVTDVLEMTIERFHKAHAANPERSFLIDHADFDRNPTGLLPLLDWLGEMLPPELLEDSLEERLLHLN